MNRPVFAGRRDLLWLLLPLLCFLCLLLRGTPDAASAAIEVDGKAAGVYPLSEPQTITLPEAEGVVIEIRDGTIFVAQSDCSDRRCMRMGRISRTGEMIVCLPHKLTITLIGSSDGADVVIG